MPGNFCLNSDFHVNLGIFYMPQIYDMGPTALLPLWRKACWGFFRPKSSTASAGCEPANLCTKGQHATPRPPKPLHKHIYIYIYTHTPKHNRVFNIKFPSNSQAVHIRQYKNIKSTKIMLLILCNYAVYVSSFRWNSTLYLAVFIAGDCYDVGTSHWGWLCGTNCVGTSTKVNSFPISWPVLSNSNLLTVSEMEQK